MTATIPTYFTTDCQLYAIKLGVLFYILMLYITFLSYEIGIPCAKFHDILEMLIDGAYRFFTNISRVWLQVPTIHSVPWDAMRAYPAVAVAYWGEKVDDTSVPGHSRSAPGPY
jgi:hypothetical protein